jgi:hypothetical protein
MLRTTSQVRLRNGKAKLALAVMAAVVFTGVTFLAAGGNAPVSRTKERLSPGKRDFCRIMVGCELQAPFDYCPAAEELGKPDFVFDSTRCSEGRTLQGRGFLPSNPIMGFQLYRFLGLEYRVVYPVSDTLPISLERLEYLLDNLPLAAKLVSYYRNEPYTAEYLDAAHTHFEGTKGKKIRGEARLISGSIPEKRLFYFGSGTVDFAFWTLRGPALMDFLYWPASGKKAGVGYSMKLLVFPGNGFINKIMNLGLFKKIVFGQVRDVLKDITETAHKLADTGGKDLLQNPKWTADEKQKIEAFLQLP